MHLVWQMAKALTLAVLVRSENEDDTWIRNSEHGFLVFLTHHRVWSILYRQLVPSLFCEIKAFDVSEGEGTTV